MDKNIRVADKETECEYNQGSSVKVSITHNSRIYVCKYFTFHTSNYLQKRMSPYTFEGSPERWHLLNFEKSLEKIFGYDQILG